jgi:hypothetical protein
LKGFFYFCIKSKNSVKDKEEKMIIS